MIDENTQGFNPITTISCSDCGEEVEFNSGFMQAINDVKEQGWRVVYDEYTKQFYHYCGECKK